MYRNSECVFLSVIATISSYPTPVSTPTLNYVVLTSVDVSMRRVHNGRELSLYPIYYATIFYSYHENFYISIQKTNVLVKPMEFMHKTVPLTFTAVVEYLKMSQCVRMAIIIILKVKLALNPNSSLVEITVGSNSFPKNYGPQLKPTDYD